MGGGAVTLDWINEANRLSPWHQAQVVVAGLGVSGFAAADGLMSLGAKIIVLDESEQYADKATLLEALDVTVRLGKGCTATLPPGTDLVVTSPGWRPTAPLLKQAAAAGIPVWGETELAWRMQQPDRAIPWLGITGTNGKTTTTQMVESMLMADGKKVAAVGNIGRPIVEAVLDEVDYDVFAVELSSFQLHWMNNVHLHSAVVLNLHEDHLEWYGDTGMGSYAADKAKVYDGVTHSCVYNVAEPATETMVEEADVVDGARAIGFTTGIPAISMIGVVDELIVDRAFVPQRHSSALELAKVSDVQPSAPHNVANAVAAAALVRSYGVAPRSVSQGLKNLHLAGHRISKVAERDGVVWVDDSKATNPHAAASAMQAYDSFVWIAGGQAKGTSFETLVERFGERMRGAIVIGVDRHMIADVLARHAPNVPVRVLDDAHTSVMDEVVALAETMVRPGDTVLLSPGCASLDMFDGYADRGDRFAEAVNRHLS